MNSHREIKLAASYNWFHPFSSELCNSFYPLQQPVYFHFQQSLINGGRAGSTMRGKQSPEYTPQPPKQLVNVLHNPTVLSFPFGGCCPQGQGLEEHSPVPGEASHCSLARQDWVLQTALSSAPGPEASWISVWAQLGPNSALLTDSSFWRAPQSF